jgi:hypothetical protein
VTLLLWSRWILLAAMTGVASALVWAAWRERE